MENKITSYFRSSTSQREKKLLEQISKSTYQNSLMQNEIKYLKNNQTLSEFSSTENMANIDSKLQNMKKAKNTRKSYTISEKLQALDMWEKATLTVEESMIFVIGFDILNQIYMTGHKIKQN